MIETTFISEWHCSPLNGDRFKGDFFFRRLSSDRLRRKNAPGSSAVRNEPQGKKRRQTMSTNQNSRQNLNESKGGNPSVPESRRRTIKLTKMAMLVAISVVFSYIHFPIIPTAPYLEYEASSIPILIGTFVFGPLGGLVIAILSILIHDMIAGWSSGPWGMLMHFISAGTLVLVAGFIYRGGKTRIRAIIAMLAGMLAVTAIMIPANLIITPIYTGAPLKAIQALILPVIVPFNLICGAITGVITFIVYKLVSPFLHKW
jgi:riboflavin transporter FmnP